MSALLASIFSPLPRSSPTRADSAKDEGARTPSRKPRSRAQGLTPRPMALATIVGENVDPILRESPQAADDASDAIEEQATPETNAAPADETMHDAVDGRDISTASTAIDTGNADEDVPHAALVDAADADANEEPEGSNIFTFKRFIDHRWDGDAMEILVAWDNDDETWEPETNLHRDARPALIQYWKSQGGRPTNPRDASIYDVYAIKKHSKDRKRLLVEWVGFGPKDATWESRSVIEEAAADVVAAYWKTIKDAPETGPRTKAKAKAKAKAKGRSRTGT